MIATAIEINSLNAPLTSCFGKAKYFAFFDGNSFKIEKNIYKNGFKVSKWLYEVGVTTFVIKEQGNIPCALKGDNNIDICYPLTLEPRLKEIVRIYFQSKNKYDILSNSGYMNST